MGTSITKDHHLWTRDTIKNVSGDVTLDIDGKLLIDKDITSTTAGTFKALEIDIDRTGDDTANQSVYGLDIDVDSTNSGGGLDFMYGINVSATNAQDSGFGTPVVYGGYFNAVGDATGTSSCVGLVVTTNGLSASFPDTLIGIDIACNDNGDDIRIRSSATSSDYLTLKTVANGETTLTTVDGSGTAAHFNLVADGNIVLDSAGDIELNADGGTIDFKDASVNLATLTAGSLAFDNAADATLKVDATTSTTAGRDLTIAAGSTSTNGNNIDGGDLILKSGGGDGTGTSIMTFSTKVSGTDTAAERMRIHTDGNVGIGENAPQDTLEVNGTIMVKDKLKFTQDDGNEYIDSLGDGYLDIDATTSIRLKSDVELTETNKLYFDGGGDTYIVSSAGDVLDIVVGGVMVVRSTEGLNGQRDWKFRDSAVGFDQDTATYDATNTSIDFRLGNKVIVTFDSGSITNLNCTFPAVSGNFLVLIKQDGTGSRTITNYKAFDSAGNAAGGSSAVKFAGGSSPTLTTDANHVDIISFYWDATNEIAYAVPTLDFQF